MAARSNNVNPDVRSVRQFSIIEAVGSSSWIDSDREIRTRVDFLKDFLSSAHANGFVLGISGGIDSALAGRLAQIAVEEIRLEGGEATFIAMKLPYGTQRDHADVQVALDFIKPDEVIDYNIKTTVDAFIDSFSSVGIEISDYHKGNAKARVRMMTQYAVAGERKLLVIGSDQAVEAASGFFTKGGDGMADVLPISGLTKRQEQKIMRALNAPESIITKTPTADLLDATPQQADETELGLTYEVLSDYLEGKTIDEDLALQIEDRFASTEHKRQAPATPRDSWWRS